MNGSLLYIKKAYALESIVASVKEAAVIAFPNSVLYVIIASEEAGAYWLAKFPESEQIKTLEKELLRFSKMGLQLIAENKKLKEQLNGKS